jgi:hypothetical protein
VAEVYQGKWWQAIFRDMLLSEEELMYVPELRLPKEMRKVLPLLLS